jgi:hypothetical protein
MSLHARIFVPGDPSYDVDTLSTFAQDYQVPGIHNSQIRDMFIAIEIEQENLRKQ